MYQHNQLFADFSQEDTTAALGACGLEQKDKYLEDEGELLEKYCSYIKKGKSHKQAAAYLKLNRNSNSNGQTEAGQAVSLPELLTMASEQGTRVSLSEATSILQHCGLPEKEQYAQEEAQRFLQACELVKQQGKTYAEVAAYFGVETTPSNGKETNSFDEQVVEAAMQIGLDQSEQIKSLVPRIVVKRLQEMVNTGEMRSEFEQVWKSAGFQSGNVESLLARVEERWESKQLPSSPTPMSLPESSMESSENG